MYKTLIVTDGGTDLPELDLKAIPFDQYLSDYPKLGEPKTRNLPIAKRDFAKMLGYGNARFSSAVVLGRGWGEALRIGFSELAQPCEGPLFRKLDLWKSCRLRNWFSNKGCQPLLGPASC